MPAVITTYLVISSLPVVVEDDGEALSYSPGTIFQAVSNNPSVVRLLEKDHIVEVSAASPSQGTTVVQGPPGPPGDISLGGWEDVGDLVRLIDEPNQVTVGYTSPPINAKVAIDAAKGGFSTGLLVVNGVISSPGAGPSSQRFGVGALADGDCSVAVGEGASAGFTNTTAIGKGANTTAAFGTSYGAVSMAGLDSVAMGAGSGADQGGVASGRGASATGLRSIASGIGATNVGQDSVLVGANGNVSGDEAVLVGAVVGSNADGAVGLGFNVTITGVDGSAYGRGASSGFANAHAFGPGATTTAPNQLVFGSHANPIEHYYFGRGESAVAPQDVRIASTRVATTQSNANGSNLVLEAGPGTGNGTPSRIYLQTAPVGPAGNSQQVLATQMSVGEGVDITNWLNIGPTSLAVAPGGFAASDGAALLHWDPATPQLNLGAEGVITRIRGVAATSSGTDGATLMLVGGTGLTTGAGGAARVVGGPAGPSGVGGGASLEGGFGVTGGGTVGVYGGTCVGAAGGAVTVQGGQGTPAGAVLVQGGLTNGVGGQSADATLSGGDASAAMIALTGNAIVKGGDGLSNNNHGGHVFLRGGLADGVGTHGIVQIETAGVARWQVATNGHLLAAADTTFDIGTVAAGRPRDLYVGRNAIIDGNLIVNGTTSTIDSEVLIADNYILLNSEYVGDAPQTSGLVLNVDPAPTTFPISGITSNVVSVSAGDPSATLSPGDFVLIQNPSNASNAGIFEVLSATATSIEIDTTPSEPFSGTSLIDDATAQGTIVGTTLCVVRSNVLGVLERGFSASAPIAYSPLVAPSLADVLNTSNTTSGNDIVITGGDQVIGSVTSIDLSQSLDTQATEVVQAINELRSEVALLSQVFS